ncbi:MAG: MFS transporter [Ktedonobacteraceae bacterium]|nr:MFS transporter [Ktedonobacteraceae bacterium]
MISTPSQQSKIHTRIALLAICLGYFMTILDLTIVNVALANIQQQLNADVTGLQWIVDGYSLVFASFLLVGGALGDRIGGKNVFLAGLALFTLASTLCSAAPSLLILQIARALQGLGAALLVPTTLALLQTTISEASERARAIGLWSAMGNIAAISGPILGGLLVNALSWRSVFLLNLPIGILCFLLTSRFIAPAFHIDEQKSINPLLALKLFQEKMFSAINVVAVCHTFVFYGVLFILSLFLQQMKHYSASLTGFALLPEFVCAFCASSLSGRLLISIGPRRVLLSGFFLSALACLAFISVDARISYMLLACMLAILGFGLSLVLPAMVGIVTSHAPKTQAGIASGMLNVSRQVGGALGVAILGSFVGNQQTFIAGMHLAFVVAVGVLALGFVSTWFFTPEHKIS